MLHPTQAGSSRAHCGHEGASWTVADKDGPVAGLQPESVRPAMFFMNFVRICLLLCPTVSTTSNRSCATSVTP